MPIYTEEQKRNILINAGFDPDQYIYDELVGGARRKFSFDPTPAPSLSEENTTALTTQKVAEQTTAGQAFLTGAQASIFPTATGILGGVALGAAGGAVAGPPGAIIGGLVGGIGAGFGGQALQEPFLSEPFKQELATSRQEHPVASLGGELLPGLLTGRPIKSIQQAARIPGILSRAIRGSAPALDEASVLLNAGITSGTGLGLEGYQQYQAGDFDPVRLAMAGIIPLGATEPNRIGRMFGLRPTPEIAGRGGKVIPNDPTIQPNLTSVQGDVGGVNVFGELSPEIRPEGVPYWPINAQRPFKSAKESAEGMLTARGIEPEYATTLRNLDYQMARAEQNLQDAKARNTQAKMEEAARLDAEAASIKKKLDIAVGGKQGYGEEAPVGQRLEEKITSKSLVGKEYRPEIQETFTPKQEVVDNFQKLTELGYSPKEIRQMSWERRKALEQQKIQSTVEYYEDLADRGLLQEKSNVETPNIPKNIRRAQEQAAFKRGQDIQYQQPIGKTPQDVPLGQYIPSRRLIKAGPKSAADTIPHESLGHGMIEDLLASPNKADNRLAKRGIQAARNMDLTPAEKRYYDKHVKAGEPTEEVLKELLALRLGREDFQRLTSGATGTLKNWLQEVKRHFKYKLGTASDDEVIKFINQRYHNDPAFGTRAADIPALAQVKPIVEKSQEESNLPEAKVKYAFYQEGYEPIGLKGFQSYHVTEDFGKFVKGSTVARESLEAAGYKIPEAEAAKETKPEGAYQEETNVPEGIEQQLGEASFRAAKDVEKRQKIPRQAKDELVHYIGNRLYDNLAEKYSSFRPQDSWKIAEDIIGFNGPDEQKVSSDWLKSELGEELFEDIEKDIFTRNKQAEQRLVENEKNLREASTKASFKAQELEAFTRPDVERNQEESNMPEGVADTEDYVPLGLVLEGKKDFFNFKNEIYRKLFDPESEYGFTNISRQLTKELVSSISNEEFPVLWRISGGKDAIGETILSNIYDKTPYIPLKEEIDKLVERFPWIEEYKRRSDFQYDKGAEQDIIHKMLSEKGFDDPEAVIESWAEHRRQVYEADPAMAYYIENNLLTAYEPPSVLDDGQRYQTESNIFQETPNVPKDIPEAVPRNSSFGFLRPLESAVDKVRRVDEQLGEAFDKFLTERDILQGHWRDSLYKNVVSVKPTQEDLKLAYQFLRNSFRGGEVPELTPKAQQAVDLIQPVYQDIRKQANDAGLLVETSSGKFREGKISDYYLPDMLSDKTLELFIKKTNTPEYRQAIQEWTDHVVAESEGRINADEAKQNIINYINALTGNKLFNIEFNALRKAQGYGIPENLRENDLLKILLKYGRRAASDLAYWKELQSKDEIATKLGLPLREGRRQPTEETLSNLQEIQGALKFVFNDFSTLSSPRTWAIARTISNALLGPATAIRNTVQLPALMLPYLESSRDVAAVFKSLQNLKESRRDSLLFGARSGTMDADRWRVLESPDKVVETFNRLAWIFRKYQGRDAMEQMDRIFTFGAGKEIAKGKVVDALSGNQKAIEWLKKFGTTVENTPENFTDADLNRVAKNFTDRVQGTYDARGLPTGAFDHPLAPFFALSRWSIEKSNVIWKDVVQPMRKGNFLPFLTYTLGSVLTGAAIRELNEVLSHKKDYTPSLKEAEGNKPLQVAALVNLMQMGAYAGIVSDVAKAGSDALIQGEVPRGPINFPLMDFASDTIGKNLIDASNALKEGDDPFNVLSAMAFQIMKQSVQGVRLLDSQITSREDSERGNKFRDLRVFKKVEGQEVPPLDSFRGNRLKNKEEREFKRTSDISEAAEKLPNILEKILKRIGQDPEKLRSELRGLKINSYQTMPNPEEMPRSFLSYIQFLKRTQGEKAASERLADFLKQREVNKVKSKLVPEID